MSMTKSIDIIRNRNREIPVCGAVLQSNSSLLTPEFSSNKMFFKPYSCGARCEEAICNTVLDILYYIGMTFVVHYATFEQFCFKVWYWELVSK
jgi:hypothetical protein